MQKIVRTIALAYNNLPRPHRIMLGSLTAVTLVVAAWRPSVYHPESSFIVKRAALEPEQLKALLLPEANEAVDVAQPIQVTDILHDELEQKATDDINDDETNDDVRDDDRDEIHSATHEYIVSSGDTLSSILTQYGVTLSDVALLASQNSGLSNLVIGQQLSWESNEKQELQRLTWQVSRRETRVYDRVGNVFEETQKIQEGEWRNVVLSGQVSGSFIDSATEAGLSRAETNAVIKALQWQLDFHKLRKGDQFTVLLSREEFDGESEQSQLLAARMRSGGKDYYAIRADDGKYYDRQGAGLASGFMRFPTAKPYRVSSHFNPHRVNPVTGRVAPHKGVDFATPIGTPVLAVGDGEVVTAKYSGAAGNHVVIRHGRQYTTHYMHLQKLLVSPGDKVKRGDRIALSGNTGRSTGPHLHYELRINKQPVNPLMAKLPYAEGLSGEERANYLAQVKEVVSQLQLN
ncbi:murein DD-endopeptidase MepM [Serratia microhaemolytica]|uniref:murein DD-endopeptidase MepM n=1 Tax=Serratia microhaemolytica TaxID=2675110 RepID=UPI000FDEEE8B|nr:murein DD-endopeptidase MepM [Serratia microhaemolytica]